MKGYFLPTNLKNFFSLFIKLLVSGNRIAIFQIILYVIAVILIPLDFLLAMAFRDSKQKDKKHTITFLSGYSRSGTTMIYQALVACLQDVEYINNLVIIFPRSYSVVLSWYRKFFSKRDIGLKNYYGRTSGLYGTNDGAQLMNLFFDKECLGKRGLKKPDRILNFFDLHSNLLKKTLIFKNCNLYLKFPELKKLFPSAIFVYVKRDPAATCLSTLKAREFIQGTMDSDWEYSITRKRGNFENYVDEVMSNIKHAYDFVNTMNTDGVIIVNYEDFCNDPSSFIREIAQKVQSTICENNLTEVKKNIHPIKPFKGVGELEKRILHAKERLFSKSKTI